METERENINNPDHLGEVVMNAVLEQFMNQVAATAGEEFIAENRELPLDLRKEAHILSVEDFEQGKMPTHNPNKETYQQRYEEYREDFQTNPDMDVKMSKASEDFNWSEISPTIFGAVFESTLNPETRRSGGMHYTSIENIHKVIDPLFFDALAAELESIVAVTVKKTRDRKLEAFQKKLASLTFLDPACGSGNFLVNAQPQVP